MQRQALDPHSPDALRATSRAVLGGQQARVDPHYDVTLGLMAGTSPSITP